MSSGRWNVDYGPVSLPVGAMQEAKADAAREADLVADASRLQRMLSKAAIENSTPEFAPDESMHGEDGGARPTDAPSEWELGLELERLWVSNGNGGRREVRLRLADPLIPNTWVRIYNDGGELQIELRAGLEGTRQWLERSALKLAEDIGSRLRCPVRVTVLSASGANATVAAFEWEGSRSS
jgi:hypothetical protein